MKINNKICTIAILLFCFNSLIAVKGQMVAELSDHPNVIMFATDDLNAWVNPLGYEQAKTPNLDRLAAMGVNFTNAHAPAAYCAPSRSAIWSGLNASSTGCYKDEIYFYDIPELVSIQTAFSKAGYKTYGAGKLYHHRAGSFDPRGWDTYFYRSQEIRNWGYEMGYRGSDVPFPDPHPYSPYYTDPRSPSFLEQGETMNYGGFLEWGPIANQKAEQMPDAVRTNWVCELLEEDHNNPFFIALGLYSPHFPSYAPQKFFDMYDRDLIETPSLYKDDLDDLPELIRRRMKNRMVIQQTLEEIGAVEDAVLAYLACVSFADAMLGRVLDALETSSYKDNTIVMFWSDQGYHHGEKGQWGKHTLWQETSHVPFIIAGNGLPENRIVETTVSLIDIYPTLIELCNLPEQHQMDGVSLAPVLKQFESAEDREVFMSYMERGGYALINSDWRYIQYHDGSEELYDLNNDPNEWNNLSSDQSYSTIIDKIKESAPTEFHEEGTDRMTLNLVITEDFFYWEPKDKSKYVDFLNCSITFANPIQQQGISFKETIKRDSVSFTEQVTEGGQGCRRISADKFCYFEVDDQFISSPDNAITFNITYLDDENNNFELQYNSDFSAKKSIAITKSNTGEWITKTLMVADAALDNRLEYQADFRITGDVYIRSVNINKPMLSDVSVTFGDQIVEKGMRFLVRDDLTKETYTERATVGDQECRYIPRGDKFKYGYFSIDDSIIDSADNNLTFEITYYNLGNNDLRMQYNAISEDYKRADFTRSNTKEWITKSFKVTDAALNNHQNNQSDFRISGEAYIKRVAVRIGTEDLEIPEVPLEYITLKETEPTSAKEKNEMQDFHVMYGANRGVLKVMVPEEMNGADLWVYNSLGQEIYRNIIQHTKIEAHLLSDSNFFIVVAQKGSQCMMKKIVRF